MIFRTPLTRRWQAEDVKTPGMPNHALPPANRTRSVLPFVFASVLALVGLADSIYLTAEHLAGHSVKCIAVRGCDEVLSSPYATLPGGVPLAALGALAYFIAFSLSTLAVFGYNSAQRWLRIVAALMLAMTLWLLYLQAFVLQAYCTYCLLSAALTLSLTALVFGQRLLGSNR